MELLDRYIKEVTEDLNITDFNVKESQLRAPARKHFWVARLINHKIDLERLEKKKKRITKEIALKLIDSAPMRISVASAEKSVEQTSEIESISDQISDLKNLIEYLEKVERIMSSLTFDLGNIIKIIGLEQT